jgi:hypothetical protein
MVILSKKSPPMSHPLNAEIMEMKRHHGVGIVTGGGHGPKRLKNGKNGEILVKKGERNSEMAAGSKEERGLNRRKLARDDHAPRVMITRQCRWESQRLFFPYHADLTRFTHSQRPVLHYIRAISQEITYGKVLGGPVIEDSGPPAGDQPETLKSTRR